jgi:hypothetical protein
VCSSDLVVNVDTLKIAVSPVRMSFDFEKAAFSSKLFKSMSLEGVSYEVPLEVSFFDNNPIEIDFGRAHLVGLTTLYLNPSLREIDKSGIYTLRYTLMGKTPFSGIFELQLFDNLNNAASHSFKILEN